MSIPLQHSVVYGPIHSRRLGVSLGINVLPVEEKFCLSSCVYCQYGATDLERMAAVKMPPVKMILQEVRKEFELKASENLQISSITLSGNGEPTLHPDLEEIIREIRQMRDRFFPGVKLGILSDSSRVHLARVRGALELLDERYMKLDAGDSESFRKINQPQVSFKWEAMVEGLKQLSSLTVQSIFIHGYPIDNSGGPVFLHWLKRIGEIKPKAVHIYTIDRAPVDFRTKAVPKKRLSEIADQVFRDCGIDAFVFESTCEDLSVEAHGREWRF